MDELSAVAVTALFSLFVGVVGKILFDWLKHRNGARFEIKDIDIKDLAKTVYSVSERVGHIMDIQCKTDGDGLPMVYMPRGYRDVMDRVAESVAKFGWGVEQNTKALKEFTEQMRKLTGVIEKQSKNGR
ncbi:MAG: hypothetical protein JW885_11590 [Deltaproteobacteria bacterium]|nr:hypothetical protein [Candidatus Zymogenaceae bacterium]